MIRNISLSLALASLPIAATASLNLVPNGVLRLGTGSYYSNHVIVTDKEKRLTSVWKNNDGKLEKIREYQNDLGKANGDKQYEGDNKTPEGIFFFNEVINGGPNLPFKKYGSRAITTNYPNLFDKREKKTGYGIWLHGIPDEVGLKRGSEGCVVINDKDIMEVTDFIQLNNTAFLIEDKVEYVSAEQLKQKREEIEKFLQGWRASWIGKDIDTYMNHYSDKFYSSRKNKNQWRAHKSHLNKVYDKIFVDFSDPVVFEVDNQLIVRTLQHYKSPFINDIGEKTIYIEREEGNLKIVAETWARVNKSKARKHIAQGTILRDTRLTSNEEFSQAQQTN